MKIQREAKKRDKMHPDDVQLIGAKFASSKTGQRMPKLATRLATARSDAPNNSNLKRCLRLPNMGSQHPALNERMPLTWRPNARSPPYRTLYHRTENSIEKKTMGSTIWIQRCALYFKY